MRTWLHRLGFDLIRWPAGTREDVQFSRLLARLRIDTVLDVGAHEGEWATSLRRLGYTGRIISYEPASFVYRKLAARAANDSAWETINAAAGRENTMASLVVRHNTMMSSLRSIAFVPDSHRDQAAVVARETVRVIRLEDEWPGGRVMLKVDTQGSDWACSRAAEHGSTRCWQYRSSLRSSRPTRGSPTISMRCAP